MGQCSSPGAGLMLRHYRLGLDSLPFVHSRLRFYRDLSQFRGTKSISYCGISSLGMPRATSEKFTRLHQAAAKSSKAPTNLHLSSGASGKHTSSRNKADEGGAGAGTSNPLFNTERFGQHILKNPLVAQAYVAFSCFKFKPDFSSNRIVDKVNFFPYQLNRSYKFSLRQTFARPIMSLK